MGAAIFDYRVVRSTSLNSVDSQEHEWNRLKVGVPLKFHKKAGRFSTLQLVRLMYGASQTHKSWVTTSLFRTSSLLEKTGEDIDLHGTIVLDCMCTAQSTQCNGPSPLTIINRGGNLLAPHDSIRFDSDYEVNDSKTIIDAYWLQQFFLCKFPCLIWVCY